MGRDRLTRLAGSALVLALCLQPASFAAKPAPNAPKERPGPLYKWKDEKGRWHYSETLPQTQDFETLELNKQGRVVRQVDLERNPQRKQTAQDKAERERQQQLNVAKQRDEALLRTYTDEREIDDSRDRNIALPVQAIKGLELRLRQSKESMQSLQAQADEYTRKGEKLPESLEEEIADKKKDIARIDRDIQRYEKLSVSIREKYDEDKRRFRELKGVASAEAEAATPAPASASGSRPTE